MRADGYITVVIPFEGDGKEVEELLVAKPGRRGNQPSPEFVKALGNTGLIHFLSIAVVDPQSPMDEVTPASRGKVSHLMIEVSSDTGATETLKHVAAALEDLLVRVFNTARPMGWRPVSLSPRANVDRLAGFMIRHHREIGDKWGMALGQVHDGSPAMTVKRILAEKELADHVTEWIDGQRRDKKNEWIDSSPMQRLDRVRLWLWDSTHFKDSAHSKDSAHPEPTKWAFAAEPAPVLQAAPSGNYQMLKAILSIVYKLLWPLYLLLTLVLLDLFFARALAGGALRDWASVASGPLLILVLVLWLFRAPRQYPLTAFVVSTPVVIALFVSFGDALRWFFLASVAIAAVAAIAVIAGNWRIRTLEAKDRIDDHTPDRDQVRKLMMVENYGPQNHMFTVSTIKPGLLRWLALRYILTMIGANPFVSRPGFLGKNGVIHSARWLWIRDPELPWWRWFDPGRLIFWSNFDGTWESYVGDFVADSPDGVTGLWSNCVGFPRAKNLIDEGAKNRDRLVRWARRQQKPTLFWYSAYPRLTNARIRINAAIRQGIASAQTDADARDWLALFASQPRLPGTLVTSQIPTLVLGGLAKLQHATCYRIRLPKNNPRACRLWLNRVRQDVTFGELLPGQVTAVALALSVGALRKLDVPENSIDTFPVPFQEGMWTPERARALGDARAGKPSDSDPSNWDWGSIKTDAETGKIKEDNTADVFLVIYAATEPDLEKQYRHLLKSASNLLLKKAGHQPKPFPLSASAIPNSADADEDADEEADEEADEDPGKKGNGGAMEKKNAPRFRTEHFGFADGVSQPAIIGLRREHHTAHNDRLDPGEIVLGYPDLLKRIPPSPLIDASEDPDHILADDDRGEESYRQRPEFSRYRGTGRRDLGANGTFLVVRQLQQHVYKWDELLENLSKEVFDRFVTSADKDGTGGAAIMWGDPKEMKRQPVLVVPQETLGTLSAETVGPGKRAIYTRGVEPKDLEHAIAAKLLGRWRDGSPLVRHPMVPGKQEGALQNNFRFGIEDPQGLACPLGAHVRRANPRDTRFPGSQEEIDSVNRHRLLRVGRAYGKWLKEGDARAARAAAAESGKKADEPDMGLMFMCLNADIERQYEFVQKTWILNRNMNGLDGETCPLTGQGGKFSIPTPRGPIKLDLDCSLVTVRGGGYFFMPGAAALKFLSQVEEKPKRSPSLTPQRKTMSVRQPDNVPAASMPDHERELEPAPSAMGRMKADAC